MSGISERNYKELISSICNYKQSIVYYY